MTGIRDLQNIDFQDIMAAQNMNIAQPIFAFRPLAQFTAHHSYFVGMVHIRDSVNWLHISAILDENIRYPDYSASLPGPMLSFEYGCYPTSTFQVAVILGWMEQHMLLIEEGWAPGSGISDQITEANIRVLFQDVEGTIREVPIAAPIAFLIANMDRTRPMLFIPKDSAIPDEIPISRFIHATEAGEVQHPHPGTEGQPSPTTVVFPDPARTISWVRLNWQSRAGDIAQPPRQMPPSQWA